jgi:predicted Zn finger-like uncharacterized protein
MILTCPECATRYFVADDKVGAAGRTVKCASCGHRWTAVAEPDLDLASPGEIPLSEVVKMRAALRAAETENLAEAPAQEIPRIIRQRADNDRKVREAAAVGVVWAGMAATLAVLIALAVVFRGSVVDIWPSSAKAYASVGLPVNRVGLTLEQVKAEPTLQDGHAALSVSGVMRNVEDRTVMAPPLTVTLMSPEGKHIGGKIAAAQDPKVPPGETRHFSLVLLDPPANASTLEVAFVYDAAQSKAIRAAVSLRPAVSTVDPSEAVAVPDAGTLRGAPPAPPAVTAKPAAQPVVKPVPGAVPTAKPLPKSSQYALPDAGHHE